ncbi:hypothetical protein DFH09DRAFT_1087463 [Mycena vulgaris]|nr:hypothetical protein DFH09DRAFT_1087463 [Mycena vulgaris]
MRSVKHGAEGANCAPLAAIASEHDSHIGFVLRLESGHVPTASQAQKMRREKGTYRESGRGCLEEDMCMIRSIATLEAKTSSVIPYASGISSSEILATEGLDSAGGRMSKINTDRRYAYYLVVSHAERRPSRNSISSAIWPDVEVPIQLPLLQSQPEERGDDGV